MQSKPRVLVLATGGEEGGGSGFQELVEFSRTDPPVLNAQIVGVVSNYSKGGVWKRSEKLGINLEYWPGPFSPEGYTYFKELYRADFVICSGWLHYVRGLDPRRTVNIHPGPTKGFGGKGFYGHHVHEAVIRAYQENRITQSAVTMHYVIEKGQDKEGYDQGPIIFQLPVLIRPEDTAETLAARVNEKERAYQAFVFNLVVHRLIHLERDGEGWRVVYENGLENVIPH
jgi:phosphoribosylglycinamide formyltransferase-1